MPDARQNCPVAPPPRGAEADVGAPYNAECGKSVGAGSIYITPVAALALYLRNGRPTVDMLVDMAVGMADSNVDGSKRALMTQWPTSAKLKARTDTHGEMMTAHGNGIATCDYVRRTYDSCLVVGGKATG